MTNLLTASGFVYEIHPAESMWGALCYTGYVWRNGIRFEESNARELAGVELKAMGKRGTVVIRDGLFALEPGEGEEHVSEPASGSSGG